MKCAGLPPACGHAALLTAVGNTTFADTLIRPQCAPAADDRLALAGQRRLVLAEPVVPQPTAAQRQWRKQSRSSPESLRHEPCCSPAQSADQRGSAFTHAIRSRGVLRPGG